jgi:Cu-Zn family superoxide dismutase
MTLPLRSVALGAVMAAAACASASSQPTPAPAPVGTRAATQARLPRPGAVAHLRGLAGESVGEVTLTQTDAGVLVAGTVAGLGLGEHAIHIHTVGMCQPPFTSAGGHYNPEGRHHGFMNPDGHHMGDMANVVTPAAGKYSFQQLIADAHLTGRNGILDADGSAVVIHASRDDYMTDPAGDAGGRIACGVITPR